MIQLTILYYVRVVRISDYWSNYVHALLLLLTITNSGILYYY